MPAVYFVPGLAESLLSTGTVARGMIWVELATIIKGEFGKMRLAANGIDPGPPDGEPLFAVGLLAPYAGLPATQLSFQYVGSSIPVRSFSWDWRKSMLTAGDALAARLRLEVDSDDPCALVCHSAGGLVARRAWSNLLGTGEEGLIRRIVTLGTPHMGSYAAVEALGGDSNIIDVLYNLNRTVGDTIGGLAGIIGYQRWTREDIRALLATWPSLYEIMPQIGAEDAASDPHRALLYTASNWGNGVELSQAHLDHARNVFTPWALSAASRPPSHVLTCVAGNHHSTPYKLQTPANLGTSGALSYTSEGDSIVTAASALLPNSQRITVTCRHDDEFPELVASGEAREWIDEIRSPSPTPPPAEVLTDVHMVWLPPIPGGPTFTGWTPGLCRGPEPCQC